MTDSTQGSGSAPEGQPPRSSGQSGAQSGTGTPPPPGGVARAPFPAIRLLYAIGFGIVAWFVFWITIVLALAQFVVVAINGKVNEELRTFTLNLIQYLWELLAFVGFVRDDQPFPIGPFPKQG